MGIYTNLQSKTPRQDALDLGYRFYIGRPCKNCSRTKRWTCNKRCYDCDIIVRKKRYDKNREEILKRKKLCDLKHKQKRIDYDAQRYQKNKENIKNRVKQYRKDNPHKVTMWAATKRARKRNQTPKDADFNAINKFYEKAKNKSITTGIPHEVDHIIPLSKGGLHHQNNLQVLTHLENRKKYNKILGDT